MDDSDEEFTIPDDWLNCGVKRATQESTDADPAIISSDVKKRKIDLAEDKQTWLSPVFHLPSEDVKEERKNDCNEFCSKPHKVEEHETKENGFPLDFYAQEQTSDTTDVHNLYDKPHFPLQDKEEHKVLNENRSLENTDLFEHNRLNEENKTTSNLEVSSHMTGSISIVADDSLNEPNFPAMNELDGMNYHRESDILNASLEENALCFDKESLSRVSPSDCVPGGQRKDEPVKAEMKKNDSIVRDAIIISGIVSHKDIDSIYDKLSTYRDRSDRLDLVTSQLLDNTGEGVGSTGPIEKQSSNSPMCIFEEVQLVLKECPNADANEVFAILESMPASTCRVKETIVKMKGGKEENDSVPILVKKGSSIDDDPLLKNDPLFCDMRNIAKVFPDIDRNEIYALLEANIGKDNRLQVVVGELLRTEQNNEMSQKVHTLSGDTDGTAAVPRCEDLISSDVERMKLLFPDCDPNYLFERLENMKDVENRSDLLAHELFDKKDYPKLKDIIEKQEIEKKKAKAKQLDMTVEEFLEKFPEPQKTFEDIERHITPLYRFHADIALKNEFQMMKIGYIRTVLDKYKGHLLLAHREMSAELVKIPNDKRKNFSKFLRNARRSFLPMPTDVDEIFYHELWFAHNEQNVADHQKQKELERKQKVEEARIKEELYECCCCYDDECLFEDLSSCPEGHLFCKVCVLRSTEAAFGEMKTKFPCLTGECDQYITLSTLQSIIPANLFSKIVRRLQEEEVLQANIPDLVTCPFCPFATVMSNPDDKIFKCLNPECLKESCRLCQEPNHIPLRCHEVEKKAERDMRTYIEDYISEAVMRKCHRCKKHFVKDSGCNKMTCVCGATSCYVCKAEDIDYDHFNNNKSCANTDARVAHQKDMERAAIEAKNRYLLDHPQAVEVEMKMDVRDLIKDYKQWNNRGGAAMQREDDGDDDLVYEDETDFDDDEIESDEEEYDG